MIGEKVRYKHSSYSTREGVVIEQTQDRVRVQWDREFFKNPDRVYPIRIKTWVAKSRLNQLT